MSRIFGEWGGGGKLGFFGKVSVANFHFTFHRRIKFKKGVILGPILRTIMGSHCFRVSDYLFLGVCFFFFWGVGQGGTKKELSWA